MSRLGKQEGGHLARELRDSGFPGSRRTRPLERADELQVLITERLGILRGQGERGEQLIPLRAGDQVIIPEDAQVSLSSLDADLVAKTTRGISVHFPAPRNWTNRSFRERRMSSRNCPGS